MKPNELIDNMVEKSKAEVKPTPKPTIPEKPKAPNPNPVAKPTAREKAEQFAKSKGYTGLDDPEYERAYGPYEDEEESPEDVYRAQNDIIRKNMETGKDLMDGVDQAKYNAAKAKMSAAAKPKTWKDNVIYNDDDVPQLAKSTYKKWFDEALKSEPSKLKLIYDNVVSDRGPESYEAKATKTVLDAYNRNGKRLAAEYMDLMDKGIRQEDAERELQKRGYDPSDIKNAYGQIRYGKEYNYWKGNDDYKAKEPVYNEHNSWESWADAMDEFVPKDWETDGWDGNTRIYTAPNGDSVWVHAGDGVTVYPANFNGPNDIKSYDSVTEYINGSKKVKANVPKEQPKTDWHELGYNLGRNNGLNDVDSDELATLIYNFMKNKNK